MSGSTASARNFYENICRLYDLELYDDVIFLYEISYASQMLSPQQVAHVMSMIAKSYYERDRFLTSRESYDIAIMFTEALRREDRHPKFQVGELKFQKYCCLMKIGRRDDAMHVLNSIAEEDMTPKALSALARLHHPRDDYCSHHKVESVGNAVSYHKKVVETCPEAIDSLSNIVRFAHQEKYEKPRNETVHVWLKAQEAISQQKYRNAITFLTQARPGNVKIMIELGRLHFALGEYDITRTYLERAHQLDPSSTYSMDILAYIFWQRGRVNDLQELAISLMKSQKTPEAWIAYALCAVASRTSDKALFGVKKARSFVGYRMNPIAVLTKTLCLIEQKKFDRAIRLLHEATAIHPSNIKLYEALTGAYLANGKVKEAMLVASVCRQNLGENNARVLLLAAYLAVNFASFQEGMELLERAVELAPGLSDAESILRNTGHWSMCYREMRFMLVEIPEDKRMVSLDKMAEIANATHWQCLQFLTAISTSKEPSVLYQ